MPLSAVVKSDFSALVIDNSETPELFVQRLPISSKSNSIKSQKYIPRAAARIVSRAVSKVSRSTYNPWLFLFRTISPAITIKYRRPSSGPIDPARYIIRRALAFGSWIADFTPMIAPPGDISRLGSIPFYIFAEEIFVPRTFAKFHRSPEVRGKKEESRLSIESSRLFHEFPRIPSDFQEIPADPSGAVTSFLITAVKNLAPFELPVLYAPRRERRRGL